MSLLLTQIPVAVVVVFEAVDVFVVLACFVVVLLSGSISRRQSVPLDGKLGSHFWSFH